MDDKQFEEIRLRIGKHVSENMKGWSDLAGRALARQGLYGLRDANWPTDPQKVRKASYEGIKKYYCAWGDWMNQMLADLFTEAYIAEL